MTCSLSRYRMLSRPYAFGCILRLRTSSEFKPGNSVSMPCFFKMQWNFFTICLVFSCCCYYYYYCNYYPQLFVVVIIVIIFCSMVISFQIHSMKMFSTLFAVILMPLMLMTSSSPIMLDFQGTYLLFNVSLPYFLYWH